MALNAALDAVVLRAAGVLSLVFATASVLLAQPAPAVWTERRDYAPGSAVVFHGDASNGTSMSPGETVEVGIEGPMAFSTACHAAVDAAGAWSCVVKLPADENAFGTYTYLARGARSGRSAGGSFTSLSLWHETRITDLGPDRVLSGGPILATAHLHVDVCRRYRCPSKGFCSFCSHDALEPEGRQVRLELGTRAVWTAADEEGRVSADLPVPRRSDWLVARFPGDSLLPAAEAQVWLVIKPARDISEAAEAVPDRRLARTAE